MYFLIYKQGYVRAAMGRILKFEINLQLPKGTDSVLRSVYYKKI